MKIPRLLLALSVTMAAAAIARAQDPGPAAGADTSGVKKRIALVNVGGTDEPLFGRVLGQVNEVFHTTPKVLAPRKAVGSDSFDGELPPLEALVKDEIYCIVALIMAGEENDSYIAVYPNRKIAFVNARALMPADGDEEKYARRLEKETVRVVANLIGIPPAPDPRCATHAYRNDAGLDAKGNNLCPPYRIDVFKLGGKINLEGHPIDPNQYYRELAERQARQSPPKKP